MLIGEAIQTNMKTLLSLLTGVGLMAGQSFAGTLIHDYELNGSLADSLGGPSLTAEGGTVGATGYSFGANQGLLLANGINPNNYSIEMRFHLYQVEGWRKLIHFKDRSSDNGLYNYFSGLNFYPFALGGNGSINPGQDVTVVLSRDGGSTLVNGSVNGNVVNSFFDVFADASFTAPNNLIRFFEDDFATGQGEASGGFVDYIKIYNGPASVPDSTGSFWIGAWAVMLCAYGFRRQTARVEG